MTGYSRPQLTRLVQQYKKTGRGRQRQGAHYRYEKMKPAYEKLKSLKKVQIYLKEGITFKQLDEFALGMSDNETPRQLNRARKSAL